MTVRKVLIAACVAALTTSPAWAAGKAPTDPPNGGHGQHQTNHGKSHRCKPHRVGYVAAGTLVDQTVVLDGEGGATASAAGSSRPTYSGDVTIDVTRTNRHARDDKGTTKTYTLDHARVVLGLSDQNGDGVVDLNDVVAGSPVKVIGKVTMLRRRCDQTGFTPEVTIKKLIVHAPKTTDSQSAD